MSDTIYLYIKTHNKTGLKYFGKTIQDPFKYKGSGTRWLNHIKKHGYDVTTEIVFQSVSEEEIKQKGIEFSNKFSIVESEDWANLKIEEGDGGWDHINSDAEIKILIAKRGGNTRKEQMEINGNSFKGKRMGWNFAIHPEKQKECITKAQIVLNEEREEINKKISDAVIGVKNSQHNKAWYIHPDAKSHTERTKDNKDDYILLTEWSKNKKRKSGTYGKKWYNDGAKNYYLSPDDNTDGLTRGRLNAFI